MCVAGHHIMWWMNDRRQECWWLRVHDNEAFNSKFPAFNKWLTKELDMWNWWGDKRMRKPFEFKQLDSLNWVGWRCTICSKATTERRQGALLSEASLFARQFSNQLPELGESQLPVVVLIQWAHELLDRPGIAGVLWVITERRPESF